MGKIKYSSSLITSKIIKRGRTRLVTMIEAVKYVFSSAIKSDIQIIKAQLTKVLKTMTENQQQLDTALTELGAQASAILGAAQTLSPALASLNSAINTLIAAIPPASGVDLTNEVNEVTAQLATLQEAASLLSQAATSVATDKDSVDAEQAVLTPPAPPAPPAA